MKPRARNFTISQGGTWWERFANRMYINFRGWEEWSGAPARFPLEHRAIKRNRNRIPVNSLWKLGKRIFVPSCRWFRSEICERTLERAEIESRYFSRARFNEFEFDNLRISPVCLWYIRSLAWGFAILAYNNIHTCRCYGPWWFSVEFHMQSRRLSC